MTRFNAPGIVGMLCRLAIMSLLVLLAAGLAACEIPGMAGDDATLPEQTPETAQPGHDRPADEDADDESAGEDDAVQPQLPDEAFQIDPDDDAAPAGEPVRVVEGGLQEPRTLNPVLVDDPLGEELSRLVFSGLTRLNPETGEPEPDLASDWETSDNGTVYQFQIRNGLTWHDGEPVTAHDVEFTFELMMDDRTRSPRFSRIVGRVSAVEATDAQTVEFRLIAPYSAFPATIATFGIVPQHVLGSVLPNELLAEPFGTSSAIGSGSFKLVHWERGERIIFETNRNHHLAEPVFDQYEYRVAPDEETFLAELESGVIDWARVNADLVGHVEDLENIKQVSLSSFEMVSVVLQLDPGETTLFENPDVRRALLHALDREEMVETIWDGHASIADSIIPESSWAATEPNTLYEFDPERAGEMLDEAGLTRDENGARFELSLLANGDNAIRRELAEWLVVQWRDLGIDASVTFDTWSNVQERITTSRDFQSLVLGYRWSIDPDQHAMWSSDSITGGFNLGAYMNSDVDRHLDNALATTDRETRAQHYADMQELVLQDLPVLPLAFPDQLVAVGPRLQGEELTAILLRNRGNVAGWAPVDAEVNEYTDDE
jgi:peptide/nickel transport system substrate-binding protein